MSEMTMVEVVARALCRCCVVHQQRANSDRSIHEDRIQPCVDDMWREFADDARAAIAAMRKQNSAMYQAALAYCEGCHRSGNTPNLEGYWQAVFDAALRESPGEPQAHQQARQEQGGA